MPLIDLGLVERPAKRTPYSTYQVPPAPRRIRQMPDAELIEAIVAQSELKPEMQREMIDGTLSMWVQAKGEKEGHIQAALDGAHLRSR